MTRRGGMVSATEARTEFEFAENLIMFIRRNDGTLSRKRREGEFSKLSDDEVTLIESIVFGISRSSPHGHTGASPPS